MTPPEKNQGDKKQVPQFVALCLLAAGLSGYFVLHIVHPGSASAASPAPAAATSRPGVTGAALPGTDPKTATLLPTDGQAADSGAAGGDDAEDASVPLPSPTMRDPFVVGYVEPKTAPAAPAAAVAPPAPVLPKFGAQPTARGTQMASIRGIAPAAVTFPGAPALPPGLNGFPGAPGQPTALGLAAAPHGLALPSAPAAPDWTVTGVLQGGAQPIAILRHGDDRRFVHTGDFVDGTYRVTAVSSDAVVLRHGTAFYRLTLGAAKAVPTSATPMKPAPALAPAKPATLAAPHEAALLPKRRLANPPMALAHSARPGLKLASLPAASTCKPLSLGLRLLNDGL